MRACQREAGSGVIKRGLGPSVYRVTCLTVRREITRHVIGEGDVHVISLVAAVTACREAAEIGCALSMTRETVRDSMTCNKREEVMIEICRAPADIDYVVTVLALSRESRLNMVRRRGRVILRRVAGYACHSNGREVQPRITGVTAGAVDVLVSADEREP